MLNKLGGSICCATLVLLLTAWVRPAPQSSPSPSSVGKGQEMVPVPGTQASAVVTKTAGPEFTRADFAVLMQQRFDLKPPQRRIVFPDVHPDDSIYAAVEAAAPYMNRQVLCPGCALSRNFFPNEAITRAISTITIVRILVAGEKLKLPNAAESENILAHAEDTSQLPLAARPLLAAGIAQGIISLRPDNKMEPSQPHTREEVTAVLDRLQTRFNLKGVIVK